MLKFRGIIIRDEAFCLDILSRLNYYRLSAYLLPYKRGEKESYDGVTFEKIYNIYDFDRRLSNLLLTTLEDIELTLRTKLAYFHAHKYGALGYMNASNFNTRHRHDKFLDELNMLIGKNRDNPFCKASFRQIWRRFSDLGCGRAFPVWHVIKILCRYAHKR